ncbi:hypothetical protein, partial [Metapseudomonas otitidis]|uniref:hypothetical protein n=1 Tax=Metapseudomonas otitidis TaxID=319939 RepID=UPI001920ED39
FGRGADGGAAVRSLGGLRQAARGLILRVEPLGQALTARVAGWAGAPSAPPLPASGCAGAST